MSEIIFEWDKQKNASNKAKHGVTFEEACSVFQDSRALIIPDPDLSDDEERFVILGLSINLNMLVVCHCGVVLGRRKKTADGRFFLAFGLC